MKKLTDLLVCKYIFTQFLWIIELLYYFHFSNGCCHGMSRVVVSSHLSSFVQIYKIFSIKTEHSLESRSIFPPAKVHSRTIFFSSNRQLVPLLVENFDLWTSDVDFVPFLSGWNSIEFNFDGTEGAVFTGARRFVCVGKQNAGTSCFSCFLSALMNQRQFLISNILNSKLKKHIRFARFFDFDRKFDLVFDRADHWNKKTLLILICDHSGKNSYAFLASVIRYFEW